MALRIKAGGPTSVLSQADAKKAGLIKTTVTAPADKPGIKPSDKKSKDEKKPATKDA
jgi:hypothetical protein